MGDQTNLCIQIRVGTYYLCMLLTLYLFDKIQIILFFVSNNNNYILFFIISLQFFLLTSISQFFPQTYVLFPYSNPTRFLFSSPFSFLMLHLSVLISIVNVRFNFYCNFPGSVFCFCFLFFVFVFSSCFLV